MAVQNLAEDAAIIVVDMQEDFCEPNGALAVKGGRDLANGINALLKLPFKLKLATQDYHPTDHCSFASQHEGAQPFTSSHTIKNPDAVDGDVEEQTITLWPDHCVVGTTGVEIIPEIDQTALSHVVRKGMDKRVESYSGFGPPFRRPAVGMSDLERILKQAGIKRVFTCGLAFDYCVNHTASDAAAAGFHTFMIDDLSNAVDADGRHKVKESLTSKGVQFVSAADFGIS